jgi:hypothetical protein
VRESEKAGESRCCSNVCKYKIFFSMLIKEQYSMFGAPKEMKKTLFEANKFTDMNRNINPPLNRNIRGN